MKPGGQRVKGFTFERKIANDLKRFFPDAKRGFQTRGGGKEQADVIGTPFHIECKHHKKVDMKAAWEQACWDSGDLAGTGPSPLVIAKSNRGPIRVMAAAGTVAWMLGYLSREQLTAPLEPGQPCVPVEFSWEDFQALLLFKFGLAKTDT